MDKVYTIPFKVIIHTKTKELQYKILNRYLTTNSFLKKIGLTENDQCTFCEQKSEDLHHLFYECSIVNNFWCNFCSWWFQWSSQQILLTYKDVLIGYSFQDSPILLNACVMQSFFIYIDVAYNVDTPVSPATYHTYASNLRLNAVQPNRQMS